MSDLIERLRQFAKDQCEAEFPSDLEVFPKDLLEAADRIEELEAEKEIGWRQVALSKQARRIEELEAENAKLREAYKTYRHAAQSAFEPGCDCATCALVRGEAIAEMSDE